MPSIRGLRKRDERYTFSPRDRQTDIAANDDDGESNGAASSFLPPRFPCVANRPLSLSLPSRSISSPLFPHRFQPRKLLYLVSYFPIHRSSNRFVQHFDFIICTVQRCLIFSQIRHCKLCASIDDATCSSIVISLSLCADKKQITKPQSPFSLLE